MGNEVAMLLAPIHRPGKKGVEVLAHFSKAMRGCAILVEVNAFLLEMLELVQIHDTGNGRLHEEGPVHSFFAEGAKHVHLLSVSNMFQADT
jgi:hypothetical protein